MSLRGLIFFLLTMTNILIIVAIVPTVKSCKEYDAKYVDEQIAKEKAVRLPSAEEPPSEKATPSEGEKKEEDAKEGEKKEETPAAESEKKSESEKKEE